MSGIYIYKTTKQKKYGRKDIIVSGWSQKVCT